MRRRKAARAGALAAPLLLAGLLTGFAPVASGAVSPGTATAGCQSWTGIQPPSPGTDGELKGVTVVSACNAWAVGDFGSDDVQKTLIEHWNGAKWTVVPSPDPGAVHNVLSGIRAASPASIWAVGGYDDGDNSVSKTLILHWDGKHWTQQKTPSPGSGGSTLSGIRSISGSEAWAVGTEADGNTDKPLILHRTGGTWHQADVPRTEFGEALFGVAATSATDVWAVGDGFGGPVAARRPGLSPAGPSDLSMSRRSGREGRPRPRAGNPDIVSIILHWNGKKWTHVPSPNPGSENLFNAVGASSRASALAVGTQQLADGSFQTLSARWNGKAWSQVPSASPAPSGSAPQDTLLGVTVTAPGNAWAVGDMRTASDSNVALIERWNGRRWTAVRAPDPGGTSELSAVAATSAGNAWAVGDASRPSSRTLALHLGPATAAGCQSWTGLQPPSAGTDGKLSGVAVVSACDAWAVGADLNASQVRQTLIEHWDGSNWTVTPSPNLGPGNSELIAVRAESADDVWAVGFYAGNGSSALTLVLHWDGEQWTQQSPPSPPGDSVLFAVRPISDSQVWAVGQACDTTCHPLALHFTGGQWHQASVPMIGKSAQLFGVAGSSARDVWAVGADIPQRGGTDGLIMHWDGTKWSHVATPAVGGDVVLNAVGVSSRTSAMAVGSDLSDGPFRTLALRWNGRTWTRVPTANSGAASFPNFLNSVYLASPTSGWAVGEFNDGIRLRSMIERWDGSRWSTVPTPDPGGKTTFELFSIGATANGGAWAVGDGGGQAFALHCC